MVTEHRPHVVLSRRSSEQGAFLSDYLTVQIVHRGRLGLVRDLHAPAGEGGEGRRAQGASPAVGDLQGETPTVGASGAEDYLRPALADEPRAAHHGRVEALRPPDHVRMLPHRPPNPLRSRSKVARERTCGEPGKAGGEAP